MKKLFFIIAICVTGLLSANSFLPQNKIFNLKQQNIKEKENFYVLKWDSVLKRYIKVTIQTSCGSTFSQVLWFDIEPSDYDFINIANAINLIFCEQSADDWDIYRN